MRRCHQLGSTAVLAEVSCAIKFGRYSSEEREDHRDDAGLVHLQRQVRRGSAVHLASDHPLRVLHRDTTLTLLDEDDTGDDQQRCEADEGEDQRTTAVEDCLALARDTRCDTGEDEEGHTVADATFGDDLAEPHDHGSTGSHDQHDDDKTEDRLVGDDVVTALEQLSACRKSDDAGRLQDCQSNGQVTRVLRHLGLAGTGLLSEVPRTSESPRSGAAR